MTKSNELDRIELSMDELFNLLKWRDNNKDLVHNYRQVIPEGIVDVKGGMTIYFKFVDDRITIYESYTDGDIMCKIITERDAGNYRVLTSWVNQQMVKAFKMYDLTFNEMDLIADTCTTVSSCMAYLEHFHSEVIERTEPIRMSNTQRRRAEWHNRNNPSKVIKLQRIVYRIPDGARHNNPDKFPRQKYTESWGVRGHQRMLRSGKEIWVHPYTKGSGAKIPKIYKLGDS